MHGLDPMAVLRSSDAEETSITEALIDRAEKLRGQHAEELAAAIAASLS